MVRKARATWRRGGQGSSPLCGEPQSVAFESLLGQAGASDATGRDQSLPDQQCYLPNEGISRAFKFKASTTLAGRRREEWEIGWKLETGPADFPTKSLLTSLGILRAAQKPQKLGCDNSSPLPRPGAHWCEERARLTLTPRSVYGFHNCCSEICQWPWGGTEAALWKVKRTALEGTKASVRLETGVFEKRWF